VEIYFQSPNTSSRCGAKLSNGTTLPYLTLPYLTLPYYFKCLKLQLGMKAMHRVVLRIRFGASLSPDSANHSFGYGDIFLSLISLCTPTKLHSVNIKTRIL
jgi:hypothetical protein